MERVRSALLFDDATFGFVALPAPLLATMIGLTVACVFAVAAGKKWFCRHTG